MHDTTAKYLAVQAGGGFYDEGHGIAHDGVGGALVTGYFCGDASFGSSSFASRGVFDVFVMHVTKSGAIDWAVQAGGDLDDKGHGIAHDGAGGSLVTGYFQGASSFGSTSLTSRGMYDAFVMHVAASGAIDVAVQAGGRSKAIGNGVAYDGGGGGALVTGHFLGDVSFGSKMVTGGDAASCFAASIMAPIRPPLPVSEKVDLLSLPPSSSPAATPTATPIRAAAPEHGPFVVTALAYSVAILMVIVFCVCCGQRWARRKRMSGRLRVPLEWMRIVMSPRASPGT